MGCSLKDGFEADLLEKYRKDGLPDPELVAAGNCTYIASKNNRGRVCNRHGGEDPPLVSAGVGTCKVRARLLWPVDPPDPASIRVILLLFGEHNHIYPVCKPPTSAIMDAIEHAPTATDRQLQVHRPC